MLKLAWTIVGLAADENVLVAHLTEALQYCPKLMLR